MENILTNPGDEHFKTVCKVGQGNDCCRYLVASVDGIQYAKHSSLKAHLDDRAAKKEMVAISDNCEGVLNPGF
jgi:hypothetical protein